MKCAAKIAFFFAGNGEKKTKTNSHNYNWWMKIIPKLRLYFFCVFENYPKNKFIKLGTKI